MHIPIQHVLGKCFVISTRHTTEVKQHGAIRAGTLPTPSQPTISRLRGRIDCSFMLTTRAIIETWMNMGGFVCYPVVDSSEQGGRDYELMVLYMVQRVALARLHHMICFLDARRFCFCSCFCLCPRVCVCRNGGIQGCMTWVDGKKHWDHEARVRRSRKMH